MVEYSRVAVIEDGTVAVVNERSPFLGKGMKQEREVDGRYLQGERVRVIGRSTKESDRSWG